MLSACNKCYTSTQPRVSRLPLPDQFSSVTQSHPTLRLHGLSRPGFPVHHQLPELAQTHGHRVGEAIQRSHLSRPLLLLPSTFPSIRVFSNESVLHIRWPKYWSFSFSISHPNQYPGLISFRIDQFDLLELWGTPKSSPTPHFKSTDSLALSFLCGPTLTSIHDYWKNHSFD